MGSPASRAAAHCPKTLVCRESLVVIGELVWDAGPWPGWGCSRAQLWSRKTRRGPPSWEGWLHLELPCRPAGLRSRGTQEKILRKSISFDLWSYSSILGPNSGVITTLRQTWCFRIWFIIMKLRVSSIRKIIFMTRSFTILSHSPRFFSNLLTVGVLGNAIRFCLDLNQPITSFEDKLWSVLQFNNLLRPPPSPITAGLNIQCPRYPFFIAYRSSEFSTSQQPPPVSRPIGGFLYHAQPQPWWGHEGSECQID